MQGKIIGEDHVDIGTEITDNGGVEHQIEMHKDTGEIYAHEQDGYPDKAAKRTPEGNEHVAQARRFAKYYVYVERGYNTLPEEINPEGLNAVRVAVADLSESEFEQFFGDLYQQMRSHHGSDIERPVEIPAKAAYPDLVLYRKLIYLGIDPLDTELREETKQLADQHGLDLSGRSFKDISLSEIATDGLKGWAAFADDVTDRLFGTDVDSSEGLYVDAVSDLHMAYLDSRDQEHVTDHTAPVNRPADAQIEIPPVEPGSLSEFQDLLVYNLACQIRDSFIRMGLEPPQPFRILGYGRHIAAERYENVDFYPDYTDPEEERAFV